MSQADVHSCGSSGSVLWSVPELAGYATVPAHRRLPSSPCTLHVHGDVRGLNAVAFTSAPISQVVLPFFFLCVKRCSLSDPLSLQHQEQVRNWVVADPP